jgi:hypothetical protein
MSMNLFESFKVKKDKGGCGHSQSQSHSCCPSKTKLGFLPFNIIHFCIEQNFNIDFQELLVNDSSYGNPLGYLYVFEQFLITNPDCVVDNKTLQSVFYSLSGFGVEIKDIHKKIFSALKTVFYKISDFEQVDKHDLIVRNECWLLNLFEFCSSSPKERFPLLFDAIDKFIISKNDFLYNTMLWTDVENWASIYRYGERDIKSILAKVKDEAMKKKYEQSLKNENKEKAQKLVKLTEVIGLFSNMGIYNTLQMNTFCLKSTFTENKAIYSILNKNLFRLVIKNQREITKENFSSNPEFKKKLIEFVNDPSRWFSDLNCLRLNDGNSRITANEFKAVQFYLLKYLVSEYSKVINNPQETQTQKNIKLYYNSFMKVKNNAIQKIFEEYQDTITAIPDEELVDKP